MPAIPAAAAASTAASNVNASNLTLQDFLNVLLTQLTYQDPLKPMDNQEFMAQLAQFTTLAQTQDLNSKIDNLVSTQAALQSVGLVGQSVTVATATGNATGTVTSLSLSGSSPTITVTTANGTVNDIPLSQLVTVDKSVPTFPSQP